MTRFALVCAADEQGLPVPGDLAFEHYVPAGVAVAVGCVRLSPRF